MRSALLWLCGALLAAAGLGRAAGISPEAVYDKLVAASGSGLPAPRLEVFIRPPHNGTIAWLDTRQSLIGIDRKAVLLCGSFGADAGNCLALLLGHELAHFYNRHDWGANFAVRFDRLATGRRIRDQAISPDRQLESEAQADVLGAWYGYMAGYDPLKSAGAVLQRLSAAYGLRAEMQGYPSMPERLAILRRSADDLHRLVTLFEAGNLLLLLGRAEPAARCFDYLGERFPSREIWNSSGVARALQAAAVLPPEKQAEAYPWTLDGETRLPGSRSRGGGHNSRALLQDARARFWRAIQADRDYVPAYINWACADDLMGQHGGAADTAAEALSLLQARPDAALAAAARAIRCIAVHRRPPQAPPRPDRDGDFEEERIDGHAAGDVSLKSAGFVLPGDPPLIVRARWGETRLSLQMEGGGGSLRAILTRRGGAGAPGRDYGEPAAVRATRGGQWKLYPSAHLAIESDAQGRILRRAVYLERE